ncbi:MAG: attachment glycoprotein G [Staphylococcus epidermidis]|nr:attachment glycoprotein G [Staphylococcus epidermidis]
MKLIRNIIILVVLALIIFVVLPVGKDFYIQSSLSKQATSAIQNQQELKSVAANESTYQYLTQHSSDRIYNSNSDTGKGDTYRYSAKYGTKNITLTGTLSNAGFKVKLDKVEITQ